MSDEIIYRPAPRLLKQKIAFFVVIFLILGMVIYYYFRVRLSFISPFWSTLIWSFLVFAPQFFLSPAVRSYRLSNGTLIVKRLGWAKRIELRDLKSAVFTPIEGLDLKGSMARIMGFAKWLDGNTVGTYQLFLTNPSKAVVLKFPDHTVVVSPDQPEQFAHDVIEYSISA